MRLYNTLTRKLEELAVHDNTVRMYVCGPTVYDLIHIGNARPMIVFDALRRYLESRGYTVIYVQNVTDIEDKIIRRAQEEGRTPAEVAAHYTEEYFRDLAALGVREPTHAPRATDYVPKMVTFIHSLVASGHAYVVDGDVYFSVRSFPGYGKLSGRVRDDQEAGARVEVDERKRDPLDFALWKKGKPGEPTWPSPWGEGRPGWHTECVVMSRDLLGETIDIHAGGSDLIFPHHENELAQAEAATGKEFVRIWLHNGLLTVRGERMGKSIGNFEYARDVVGRYGSEAVRYFYLSRDWRKPLDFSHESLAEAKRTVDRVYDFLWAAEALPDGGTPGPTAELDALTQRFHDALEEDFTTPAALAVLQEIVGLGHRRKQEGDVAGAKAAAAVVRELGASLGLFQAGRPATEGLAEDLIRLLIELRAELRTAKQFALADRVRDRLGELGIELRDGPQGTTWALRPSSDEEAGPEA
ncbi:MAG: cysteine--tRNA ligase [Candidatus Bipolaricaulis sp.]|nr:cysteine--tRNA ligase [Candidatus Bipolaricaulis sp.]MDY0391865.1 cysteine--tRNA ligase [Candidatus Bipolaricaulis sp.]